MNEDHNREAASVVTDSDRRWKKRRLQEAADAVLLDPGKFGRKLKESRNILGIGQKELAEKTGVHTSTLGKWELGRRMPNVDKLQALSRVFDVPPDFFLTSDLTVKQYHAQQEADQQNVDWDESKRVFGEHLAPILLKVKARDRLLSLITFIADWEDEAVQDLLTWCNGYAKGLQRGKSKAPES